MAPRQDIVHVKGTLCYLVGIDAANLGRLLPRFLLEQLGPRVETSTTSPRLLDPIGALTPAAAHDRLHEAGGRIVPTDADGTILHAVAQQGHAAPRLLRIDLAIPLERGLGLGNEQGARDRNLKRTTLIGGDDFAHVVKDALAQGRDTLDIFVGLRGQANHEIQLATAPTRFDSCVKRPEQVLLGHILVDHVAQTLRAGLRGKGKAAFFRTRDQVGHLYAKGIETLGRNGHADAATRACVIDTRQDVKDLGVVRGGQRGQAHLVIAGLGQASDNAVDDVVGATLTDGTIHHACLAKTTPTRTSAQDLHVEAVMDDLGEGNDVGLPP